MDFASCHAYLMQASCLSATVKPARLFDQLLFPVACHATMSLSCRVSAGVSKRLRSHTTKLDL